MSRILVTGASGFVGGALLPVLLPRHRLVLAQRRVGDLPPPAGTESRIVGEIGPETEWSTALRDVDQVVHLAAHVHVGDAKADPEMFMRVNAAGTRRLAEAASRAGVARFVFLSSVKVNGDASGDRPFRESDPPHPEDAYARSKWAAEQALAALAANGAPNTMPIRPMEIVILRPPLVYGPGAKANFRALVRLCLLGVPLPFGDIDNQRSLIYSGNLADAIGCVIAAPFGANRRHPACRTYLLRDGRDLSTGDLVRALAAGINREARLPALPPDWLRTALRLIGKGAAADRLLGSLAVDDSRFRADYGWSPPYGVIEALAITARWFRDAAEC